MRRIGGILGGLSVVVLWLGFVAAAAFAQPSGCPSHSGWDGTVSWPGATCVAGTNSDPAPSGAALTFNFSFTQSSSGPMMVETPTTVQVTFGDGTTASAPFAQMNDGGWIAQLHHIYHAAGSYPFRWTVWGPGSDFMVKYGGTLVVGGGSRVGSMGSFTAFPISLSSTNKKLIGLAGLAAGVLSLMALTGGFRSKAVSFATSPIASGFGTGQPVFEPAVGSENMISSTWGQVGSAAAQQPPPPSPLPPTDSSPPNSVPPDTAIPSDTPTDADPGSGQVVSVDYPPDPFQLGPQDPLPPTIPGGSIQPDPRYHEIPQLNAQPNPVPPAAHNLPNPGSSALASNASTSTTIHGPKLNMNGVRSILSRIRKSWSRP